MARKPRHTPLYRLETLRPNGAPFASEDHAFIGPYTLEQRAAELRGKVRSEHGWTPGFRVLRIDRNATPWGVQDVTATYLPRG